MDREAVVDFLAFSFGLDGGRCMAEAWIDAVGMAEVFDMLVLSAPGDPNDPNTIRAGLAILEAADACGVPFGEVGPTGQPGQAYGDNPVLDELQDRCAAGDGQACEELFASSGFLSQYEFFGGTWGERIASLEGSPPLCEGTIQNDFVRPPALQVGVSSPGRPCRRGDCR